MEIKVLGACCKKSLETYENAKKAVNELGWDATVTNIGDNMEIASYGVMSTPGLVKEGKVLSTGKPLTVAEIKILLTKN